MNCNGRRLNLFVIYLIIVFLQIMAGQPSNDCNEKLDKMKIQGNLYDVFQKRLEKFNNEMGLSQGKRSTVGQCLYEEFKKRIDKINNELSLDGKDMFNALSNSLRNDRSSIKNKLDDDPHTPIKEDLYEASRKRLDKIGTELHLKERCSQRRNGRSAVDEIILENNDFSNLLHSAPILFQNQNSYEFTNNANNYKEFANGELYGDAANEGLFILQRNNRNQNTKWSNLRRRQASSKSNVNSKTPLLTLANDKSTSKTPFLTLANDKSTSKTPLLTLTNDKSTSKTPFLPLANDMSTSYPGVLARTPESNTGTVSRVASANLLSSMAQKLNTSPLELAKKVAKTELNNPDSFKNDPQLSQILQKYISNTVQINSNQRKPKQTPIIGTSLRKGSLSQTSSTPNQSIKPQSMALIQGKPHFQGQPAIQCLPSQAQIQLTAQSQFLPTLDASQSSTANQVSSQSPSSEYSNNSTESPVLQDSTTCAAPSNISLILDKVLSSLEHIEAEKNKANNENLHPEGAPCSLRGTWSSYVVGLHFHISEKNEATCDSNFSNPVEILIEVNDTSPPKRHEVINEEWRFTGTAMKLMGGPFYLIAQNRSENVLATFAGYCRTCGGTDTIFGSWTFVFPSKDCQDVSVSIETKRDILRRSDLEEKRDIRLKELAGKQYSGKKRL